MKPAAATAVGAAPEPPVLELAPPAALVEVVVAAPPPEPPVEELPVPEDCKSISSISRDQGQRLTVEVMVSPALLVVVRVVRAEVLPPVVPLAPDVPFTPPAPDVELPAPPAVELPEPEPMPPLVELAPDGVPVDPAPATPETVEVVLAPVARSTVLVPEPVAVAVTVVEALPEPDGTARRPSAPVLKS